MVIVMEAFYVCDFAKFWYNIHPKFVTFSKYYTQEIGIAK